MRAPPAAAAAAAAPSRMAHCNGSHLLLLLTGETGQFC
eukprot:COSAG01_NODE_53083_length_341_cov_2.115702_1_plen_37_part_10